MDTRKEPRWLIVLFVVVAVLHLLPVLRVRLLPTVDGPSHAYNAFVLRELATKSAVFGRVFVAQVHPTNWLGHAVLFAGLSILPVVDAEKLLVSLIIMLLLTGCWRVARLRDPSCGVYAFLAMPLAFNFLMQMGFYNDMLAVALSLHAIASWWQRRNVAAAVWLLFCAFSHPLPAAVAMAVLGAVWLIDSRDWRRLLPFAPAALIVALFLLHSHAGGEWTWKDAFMIRPVGQHMLLSLLDARERMVGYVLAAIYGALILATLIIERRNRWVFAVMGVVAIILFVVAPVSVQEGLVLKARLLVFPYMLILPWFTPRLARAPLAIALALIAVVNVVYVRNSWKHSEQLMVEAIRPILRAEPCHTFLPLMFERSSPWTNLEVLGHASSYAAARQRLVDYGNYEAGLEFFPVSFRPGLQRPSIYSIEAQTADYDVAAYANVIDYIYTWKLVPGSGIEQRLAEHYDVVASEGYARLYKAKR